MTSRFVTLSDYCILEYMLTPLGDASPQILNTNYYSVKNAHVDLFQIYNTDAYTSVTKNARGLSVVPIGGSKLVRVDLTDVPIYTDYDPLITEVALSNSYTNALIMDTMRFHFASGFNFTEVENIVLGARQKLNNLQQIQLVNILMTAETAQDLLTFNPRPLFLANTIYDKYIDIKVPAPAYMDEDFTQFGTASFESVITDNIGFIKGAPITVSLSEASYEDLYADNNQKYEVYRVVNYYEGSVPQINEFDSLGAIIQESTAGDYIEFFATWNSAFPEDLIATLNAKGVDNDWIIIHQLQVYEQIGSSIVPSGNFVVYQENNFDAPLKYRPILNDAGFSVSMSIDYIARLMNKKTGDQVIRTGSMTIFNPNKYGRYLAKLELANKPQSMKVYNKIVQKNLEITNLFTGAKQSTQTESAGSTKIVYKDREVRYAIPAYQKQANIRLSQKNALLTTTDGSTNLVFGQGELTLPIDPTDNFIRFTVYSADSNNPSNQRTSNLNTGSKYTLNFGKNATYSYESINDPAKQNPSVGQIAFRIPKDQAKKILDTSDSLFYISVIAEDSTETLMYTGKWMSSSEYAAILKANEAAKTTLINDPQAQLNDLKAKYDALASENENLKKKIKSQKVANVSTVGENTKNINTAAGYRGLA